MATKWLDEIEPRLYNDQWLYFQWSVSIKYFAFMMMSRLKQFLFYMAYFYGCRFWKFHVYQKLSIRCGCYIHTEICKHTKQANKRVGIPLTDLTLPHFCACPKQGPGFQISYVIVNDFRWEVVIRFVDIGGIVDQQFLFLKFIYRTITTKACYYLIWYR